MGLNPGRYVSTEVENLDDEVFEESLVAAHVDLRELAERATALERGVDASSASCSNGDSDGSVRVGWLSLTICTRTL